MKNKTIADHGCNSTTGPPLAMEIATFPGRHKPFKMKREMKTNTSFDILNDRGSSRTNIAKAKIVPSMPDEELTDVENVDKNPRNNQQLIRVKTKKGMTTDQRRSQRR
jgi:hypothetical protein